MAASVNPLPAAGAAGLTDAQLRATPVPVSGTVTVTDGSGPVTVDGTVTVANPTTNPETGLAKDATLTGGTMKTKIVDTGGTNVASVSAAGAVKVDASGVAVPVTGTFFQGTQPVSLATNTPDVTDRAARLLGHVTVDNASLAVTIAATQAVNVTQLGGVAIATGSGASSTGTQRVIEAGPAAADILVGHVAQTATTAAATVITIPINRTWRGTITITCDVANTAVTGTTAGQALGTITTVGASAVPAAGTVATCEARVGANTATIGGGAGASNSITVPMVVSAGASALATIALASTIAGTNGRVACICSGVLV